MLSGRRVVVTRALGESQALTERLAARGAEVTEVPLIATAPAADGGVALASAAAELVDGAAAWVVVSSPTGARHLLEALGGRVPRARVAAVGPGTASVLTDSGLAVDLVPSRHVGEGLVEAFPPAPPLAPARGSDPTTSVAGGPNGGARRVLVVRAAVARDVVPEGLEAKGWTVEVVEAYRTVPAPVTAAGLAALASSDVVTLTSSSCADALAEAVAGGATQLTPADIAVVCMGPVTAGTAVGRGLRCLAVAEPHTLDGLVAAVEAAVGRNAPGVGPEGSDRRDAP